VEEEKEEKEEEEEEDVDRPCFLMLSSFAFPAERSADGDAARFRFRQDHQAREPADKNFGSARISEDQEEEREKRKQGARRHLPSFLDLLCLLGLAPVAFSKKKNFFLTESTPS
jgi:hypothetical protein